MADDIVGVGGVDPDEVPEDEGGADEALDPVDPVEVDEPETTEAGGPWSRMPGWVTGVVTLLSLAGFGFVIYKGWDFIVSNDEEAEAADWEQLLGLIDRVDNLVLFILGAVFGVAVQARQTADAKGAADKNRNEARRQHQKARANRDRARTNKRAAMARQRQAQKNGRVAREAFSKLRHAIDVVDKVEGDPRIAFVEGHPGAEDPHVAHVTKRLLLTTPEAAQGAFKIEDRHTGLDELAADLRSYVQEAERRLE